MREKKRPEHRCNTCGFYKSFYIKKDTCFEKLKDGYCKACGEIKDGGETCEQWAMRRERCSRKWICRPKFRELMFHLTAIKDLIREENGEKNEELL